MLLRLTCILFCLTSFVHAENSASEHTSEFEPLLYKKSFLEKSHKANVWDSQIQKIPPPDLHWIEGSKRSVSKINSKLSNYKNFSSEYNRVRKLAVRFHRSQIYGLARNNVGKCRHPNYIPFDDVRTLRHLPNFYLAASDVHTDEQAYIVTQAPFKSTLKDFWKAVLETRTKLIVKLMNTKETSTQLPIYYKSNSFPVKIGNWTIKFLKEELKAQNIINQKIIERRFIAKNHKTNESRLIRHIHYDNWPDHGIPNPQLFSNLLTLVEQTPKKPNGVRYYENGPILVHCKAGIGRSGSFVLGHTLRKKVMKGYQNINPVKVLTLMRMQRKQLVSSPKQYHAGIQAALMK